MVKVLLVLKEYNMARRYNSKHKISTKTVSVQKRQEVATLNWGGGGALESQQNVSRKQSNDSSSVFRGTE
jgi:hypothetical protein